MDEGTQPADCYNFVQDGTCDSASTDCALQNQSLGQKYDTGFRHGQHGEILFSGQTAVGMTMAIKYSPEFVVTQPYSGFKNDEILHNSTSFTSGYPMGQDSIQPCPSRFPQECIDTFKTAPNRTETDMLSCDRSGGDLSWGTRLFTAPGSCATSLAGASMPRGAACCAGELYATPYGEDFPGGSFSWPRDKWACVRTWITGIGTANYGLKIAWKGEDDTAEAEVFEMTGFDTTGGHENGLPVIGLMLNNFHNGGDGEGSGYCTDGAGAPISPACPRAYRYEDNIVFTDGEPVTCAEIGL